MRTFEFEWVALFPTFASCVTANDYCMRSVAVLPSSPEGTMVLQVCTLGATGRGHWARS